MTDLRITNVSRTTGSKPVGKPGTVELEAGHRDTSNSVPSKDEVALSRATFTRPQQLEVLGATATPTKAPSNSSPPSASPKLLQESSDAAPITYLQPAGPDLSKLSDNDLGAGFHPVAARDRSAAQKLQTFLAHRANKPYECVVTKILDRMSDTTKNSAGVDIEGLLNVERTLYQSLSSSREGYMGGTAPLFQALADGKAAYVNLGPERQSDAEHLMRMFANLPISTIEKMDDNGDDISKIRKSMVERAKAGDFPVFVDMDGDCDTTSPSESIALESIASIAKRENNLGDQFPDPRRYYKWLVTRVDSAFRCLDPWFFGNRPEIHKGVEGIKTNLTPPWLETNSKDPFGFTPHPNQSQAAYGAFMKIAGGGEAPSWGTLRDVADATVCLDRDLISGIQTYWMKFLREISPEQRGSLLPAVARSWVRLNTLAPDSPEFTGVSPTNAPYIQLYEKSSDKVVEERYDRAMALSQAVDHSLDGLGIIERREMLKTLMTEIEGQRPALEKREQRLRDEFGSQYIGLDVDAILSGAKDINDPEVKEALGQLRKLGQPEANSFCPMTLEHAEIIRHRDLMEWVASRYTRYGDIAVDRLLVDDKLAVSPEEPLILGEFWVPPAKGTKISPLPPLGQQTAQILGKPIEGRDPVPTSVVLEGGGGKGFAYVEAMRQTRQALESASGQVAINEFVGNSAGSISAGLMAAGYTPDELGEVLKKLDFKKFYSDYLWLSGGVDPKARGIDRTGLFSMQKMYKTISELIQAKVPVEGRPVLFRDLPYQLKVTSTLLNSDLSEEQRADLKVGKDGQIVFSPENTPNMDVAAAICSSAAIPGFFNSPQLQVCGQLDRAGSPVLHRMQMIDGGTVNNFPIGLAGQSDEKAFLINLPTFFRAPSLEPGGPPVELSTLNFDSSNLAAIDAHNKKNFARFAPQMASTVQTLASEGYQRAVLAFDLADEVKQPAPIVQGRSRAETNKLLKTAEAEGLPHMSAKDGAKILDSSLKAGKTSYLEQIALNALLDRENTFEPGLFHEPRFHQQTHEATGLSDMIAGALAAKMTAPSQIHGRQFENS